MWHAFTYNTVIDQPSKIGVLILTLHVLEAMFLSGS
jgi:hypothetical protein